MGLDKIGVGARDVCMYVPFIWLLAFDQAIEVLRSSINSDETIRVS